MAEKTNPGPSLTFAGGLGILAYVAMPESVIQAAATQGIETTVVIAATSAVIAPFALVGKAMLDRAIEFIQGKTK